MPMVETINREIGRPADTLRHVLTEGHSEPHPTSGLGIIMFPMGTLVPETHAVLREAVTAAWEPVADGILIYSPALGDESLGADWEAASFQFLTSLADRLEAFESRADQLSAHDRRILVRLRSLLDLDATGGTYGTTIGR